MAASRDPRVTVLPPDTALPPDVFYPRELPPLHAVLDDLSGLGLLVADGYADLDLAANPACARMHTPRSASR